jgi:hypothetical protein
MPQSNSLLKDYLDIPHGTKVEDGMLVRKKNPDRSDEIDSGQWLLQRLNDLPAEAPMFVSELYQLWSSTAQPLVESVVDDPAKPKNHFLLTSAHFTSSPSLQQLNQLFSDNHSLKGLASILVISLLVGQGRYKKIGLNANNEFINLEFINALCLLQEDNFGRGISFDFTRRDLESLPLIADYLPYQWLDFQALDMGMPVYFDETIYKRLARDPQFLEEKYRTILNIILTPDYVLQDLADERFKNQNLKQFVLNMIKSRIVVLEQQALLIRSFREYVYRNHNYSESLLQNLQHFQLDHSNRAPLLMKLKFNKINSEEEIERYVSDSKKFSDAYKKTLFTTLALDNIHKAKTLDEVLEYVKYLKSSPDYNIVKHRSRNFNLSFLGTQFNGVEVSNTFSQLIKAAKNQMIRIATQHANVGDISDLQTLASDGNEFHDLIHAQRFRFFKKQTDSDKAVAKALASHAPGITELMVHRR